MDVGGPLRVFVPFITRRIIHRLRVCGSLFGFGTGRWEFYFQIFRNLACPI